MLQPTSVRFRPMRAATAPAGMPSSAHGSTSAATTSAMRDGEPVVVRTNQGNARNVICEPVAEIASATTSAAIGGRRSTPPIVPQLRPADLARRHAAVARWDSALSGRTAARAVALAGEGALAAAGGGRWCRGCWDDRRENGAAGGGFGFAGGGGFSPFGAGWACGFGCGLAGGGAVFLGSAAGGAACRARGADVAFAA